MLGYSLQELGPQTIDAWNRLSHPDDKIVSDEMARMCLAKERKHYELETRMRHREGHWIWIVDRGCVSS